MRKKMARIVKGWLPDLPDVRDLKFKVERPKLKVLPASVNLQNIASAVEDQLDQGSCVANAWVSVLEALMIKHKKNFKDLSRQFLYYMCRFIEGTVDYDAGATLRDGSKALVKYGVCLEKTWPYDTSKMAKKPSKKAYMEGLYHQVTSYHRLSTLADMKQCLAQGFPFVFGMSVYESFMSEEVEKSGIVPMPQSGEKFEGGHALACFGYDDSKESFLIKNSWSKDWGLDGYCWIPYQYLSNRDLSDDFWTATAAENM
jgi:C1A family cysteine protease